MNTFASIVGVNRPFFAAENGQVVGQSPVQLIISARAGVRPSYVTRLTSDLSLLGHGMLIAQISLGIDGSVAVRTESS